MPTEILMPALSPTMEEGTLARWLKKEGDAVKAGDVIAEIETDKATMEFEAVDEGVMGRILVPEGTEGVKVNAPIAVLLAEGESADAGAAPAAPAAAAPVAAPSAAAPVPPSATPVAPAGAVAAAGPRLFASPLARRIAAERGLDLGLIAGSGPRGRIVKADVLAARPAAPAVPVALVAAPAPAAPPAVPPAAPATDAILRQYEGRRFEEVKLDGMRRIIAQRLGEAKQTIPHFYLRRDIRLDALLALRAEMNRALEGRGVKLSVNDFVIKASALALQQVPDANAVWAGDRILRMKASDVAVAVAVEGGLFTPVLKDAEQKSLSALSTEMKDLAQRARTRRLAPQEYQGGSFAISNLGMFGIDSFDAVINPPHGAILAVGAGARRAVVTDAGAIEAATVMTATLSVDHRVIDGALGAALLGAIRDLLENPLAMLA
ncbi:MAG: pyruvate dehydrogenase complex dihydrolipoamide acetyltransferase [Rubellimicrobium sp.]|nr:pyruvate dehydrogenase complex dihydrolipoamide acetyltransferase [Rubellimicrobium sp.]